MHGHRDLHSSLHDALPILLFKSLVDEGGDLLLGPSTMQREGGWNLLCKFFDNMGAIPHHLHQSDALGPKDRKSTRLNSSHGYISYAVFCLKKKKEKSPSIP